MKWKAHSDTVDQSLRHLFLWAQHKIALDLVTCHWFKIPSLNGHSLSSHLQQTKSNKSSILLPCQNQNRRLFYSHQSFETEQLGVIKSYLVVILSSFSTTVLYRKSASFTPSNLSRYTRWSARSFGKCSPSDRLTLWKTGMAVLTVDFIIINGNTVAGKCLWKTVSDKWNWIRGSLKKNTLTFDEYVDIP